MEEECVTGLYKSLGVSVGSELSPDDVCTLFHKVLHHPSSQEDAVTAIRRVAGQDRWSCTGRKVLDVLLEMERERGRREEVYWDLQLLRTGTQTHPSMAVQETRTGSGDQEDLPERRRLARAREQGVGQGCGDWGAGMWRLKRTARQSWARLIIDGVCSVLPSLSQGESLERVERTRAGVPTLRQVSVPELHLLMDVKYDTVTHTLLSEMLQENLGQDNWESLLPWQQEDREAELGEMIEKAQETGDLLHLGDLPGAFRIYRSHESVSSKSCPDWIQPRVEFWTAIFLLTKIQASLKDERKELKSLSERLDQPAMQLVSLYVRLATVRAQRELHSPGALLVASQSWHAWPSVRSPGIKERARLLLQEAGEEGKAVEPSPWMSTQQAVLYYMVLSQEQERRYLLRLLHGVSLEDLQGLGGRSSPAEVLTQQREIALREACVRKMKHTHATLQTYTETQSPQGSPILQLQPQSQTQTAQTTMLQTQDQTQGQTHLQTQGQTHIQAQDQTQSRESAGSSSQSQWGACALVLLTQLMELQEAQLTAVLPSLVDMKEQHLLALRKEYECELRNPRLNCLLILLTSDTPPISSSLLTSDPCPEPSPPIPAQNNVTAPIPEQRRVDGNLVHTDERRERQDICTGCGETFEDLPYLEILCAPTAVDSSHAHQSSAHASTGEERAHGAVEVGQEGSPTKTPQIFEKQDSLITLAWSKPLEGTTEPQAAATDVSAAAAEQDSFSSMRGVSACDTPGRCGGDTNPLEETGCGARQQEALNLSLFQSSSKAGPGQSESATVEVEWALDTPLETGEARCNVDLCTQTLVTHTETTGAVDVAHTHSVSEEKAGMSGVPTEESIDETLAVAPNELAYLGAVGGQHVDQEVCDTVTEPWTQSELDQPTVDQAGSSVPESAREPESMLEREWMSEPVSVLERERTMRSLVDMQQKVEQKKQRDRERQLLRVQERLSIIQNRKSEEDLLGLKQKDRLRHLTRNLPQEDKSQQKTVVRERLEQLRRERSYVMQSRRDRNTAGFKELLAPVVLQGADTEEGAD